ncbi:MAG: FHA domain-containing protein [Casimicrobiaceae bacterium]
MAKLVLSTDGTVVFQCFLDSERLQIGRLPSNQVVIDDPRVGAAHALIVSVGNDHILENLHNVTGTYVNGTRVERHILQHSDVIEFGAYNLRYLNPRVAMETGLDRTMIISGLKPQTVLAPEDARPSPESLRVPSARPTRSHAAQGRIVLRGGPRARSTIELDRVVTLVGVPGKRLAVITRRPHGYFLTHVEGDRMPKLNGRRIDREARQLRDGDEIEVGGESMRFKQD